MDTWGYLREGTPFAPVFPDGKVPLRSIIPITPREAGHPRCYLVDIDLLSDAQIEQLAALLYELWKPECESVEAAAASIRETGLPLKTEHFTGAGTTRVGMFLDADLGDDPDFRHDEMDDEGDWHDDDDDEGDYWLEHCGWVRGQGCTLAATEECDFECPFRRDYEKGLALTQARMEKRRNTQ